MRIWIAALGAHHDGALVVVIIGGHIGAKLQELPHLYGKQCGTCFVVGIDLLHIGTVNNGIGNGQLAAYHPRYRGIAFEKGTADPGVVGQVDACVATVVHGNSRTINDPVMTNSHGDGLSIRLE